MRSGRMPRRIHHTESRESPAQTRRAAKGDPVVSADGLGKPILARNAASKMGRTCSAPAARPGFNASAADQVAARGVADRQRIAALAVAAH